MTKLVCTAKNCYYNEDKMCCLGNIKVDGQAAMEADSTKCSSFVDKKSKECNSCGCSSGPKKTIAITCEAMHCQYNMDRQCTANKVNVEGPTASESSQTMCGTFKHQ